jgi:hypothetical protein
MAGISGVNGNIAIANAIGGIIKSWTANFTRASTDITGFGNATRNRAVGIIDLTGSMTGSLDSATSPTVAFTGNTAAADITLTAEAGNTLVFKAIIDSITVGVSVDGEATFSANYAIASTATTFTNAVAVTWS